jgi:hypothetical protein
MFSGSGCSKVSELCQTPDAFFPLSHTHTHTHTHTHPPLCRRTGKGAGRLTLRQRPCFPKVDHEVFEVFEAEHRLVQPLPIVGLRKSPTSVYATPVLCQLEDSESWCSLGTKKKRRSKIRKEEHAQTTSTMDSLQTGSHQREAEVSTHARRKRKREKNSQRLQPNPPLRL